jgi:hypothetical protein
VAASDVLLLPRKAKAQRLIQICQGQCHYSNKEAKATKYCTLRQAAQASAAAETGVGKAAAHVPKQQFFSHYLWKWQQKTKPYLKQSEVMNDLE